jgi:leader peptidase (prepilin peptidase)/N-methyltransferase
VTTASTLLTIGSALVGAVVGAVTPLPAYRRSVEFGEQPRSTCEKCDSPLPPATSFSTRCGGCGARLGPSRLWTIPVGAVSFGLLAAIIADPFVLAAALILAGLALPLAAIDLAVMRLPDPLVLIGFACTTVLLTAAALVNDDWPSLLRAAEGGAICFAVYFLLAVLPGASLGFGDVKLGGVIGLLLGYLGWGAVILGLMLPWLVNAPVAVATLVRHGRKASQPFGPALLAGSFLAIAVLGVMNR